MINITINDRPFQAEDGMTILDAAKACGIDVPTLCFLKDINKGGVCRICVCEVEGAKTLMPACATKVSEGMNVRTESPVVIESRRQNLEFLASHHNGDCTECKRGNNCELQELCQRYGVDIKRFDGSVMRNERKDSRGGYIIRDNTKCILCRRCVSVCRSILGESAIGINNRGGKTRVGINIPLNEAECVHCGMCAANCPVGALTLKYDDFPVWKAISDKRTKVAAIVTPEAASQFGECFGDDPGKDCSGRMVTMLRRIGFDYVYKAEAFTGISMTEGLRILEEDDHAVADITCPAAGEYLDFRHPELHGRTIVPDNTYKLTAEQIRAEHKDEIIFAVAITTCSAEKSRCDRDGLGAALSVPEAAAMVRRACVSSFTTMEIWNNAPDSQFDQLEEMIDPIPFRANIRLLICPDGCAKCGGRCQRAGTSVY